jgi:hypothetical protein
VKFARRLFGVAAIGLAAGAWWKRRRGVSISEIVTENATDQNGPQVLRWQDLMQLDYRSGRVRGDLQARILKEVHIPGFVVPLEDEEQNCSEFLLVPHLGACIHTPPPPPNQIVYARAASPQAVGLFDAVWAIGQLQLLACRSPYGEVAFQMKIRAVKIFAKG